MPRYVVLEHDHPSLHWDFMLETGNRLRCWRLLAPPCNGKTIQATPLGDHRFLYLDYEGPVSGKRGRVVRWDSGTYEWIVDKRDRLEVMLQGDHLQGRAILTRVADTDWVFKLANN